MQRGDRAERAVPAAKLAGRSPFVRLNELLEGVAPGKPPISMAVGEPRHPIPSFVGPVLQQNLSSLRPLPDDARHRALPRRRRRLARSPLQARQAGRPQYGNPRPQRQPRRPVSRGPRRAPLCRRARRNSCRADAQSLLSSLCRRRGLRRLRADRAAGDPRERISARLRRAARRVARTHGRDLSLLAGQPAGRGACRATRSRA